MRQIFWSQAVWMSVRVVALDSSYLGKFARQIASKRPDGNNDATASFIHSFIYIILFIVFM